MTAPATPSQAAGDWTYTFVDARTGAELATLPMVGVSFEKVLNGAGKLSGTVPTVDPDVRALDPWAATEPRRTMVYVEYRGVILWGGMVWQRIRSQDQPGLQIVAATLESWLATQLPTVDYDFISADFTSWGAVEVIATLLHGVAQNPGGDLGLVVASYNDLAWDPYHRAEWSDDYNGGAGPGHGEGDSGMAPDPVYGVLRDWYPNANTGLPRISRGRVTWPRNDLKDALQRMGEFLATQTPIEFRFDFFRQQDGTVARVLLVGEPRIGRTTDLTDLAVHYPGTLLTWTDTEDGTVQGNAAAGTVDNPNAAVGADNTTKLWAYHTAADVDPMLDEVAQGYPLMMRAVTTVNTQVTSTGLDDSVLAAVADALSQGRALTNFTLRIDTPDARRYDVGDDLDLEIVHPSYPEYPLPHPNTVRILGKKVTPRGPGQPDSVQLTVVDSDSERLPHSTTLVAHMRDLERRVKAMEAA